MIQLNLTRPIAFFDLETTGLEFVKNVGVELYGKNQLELWHTIIEIGWVTVRQRNDENYTDWLVLQRMNLQISPNEQQLHRASKEALAVNGYLERKEAGEWKNALKLRDALWWFISNCGGSVLININPCFDDKFLEISLAQAHIPYKEFQRRFHYRILDVNSIAVGKLLAPGSPYKTNLFGGNALSKLLGIKPETEPHMAVRGAEQAYRIYRRLMELKPREVSAIRRRMLRAVTPRDGSQSPRVPRV